MYINCHSYFSLKYGTMSPEDLLREAEIKNIECVALTDINNTSGVLDFVRIAKKYKVKPVVGIDFRKEYQVPSTKYLDKEGEKYQGEKYQDKNKNAVSCFIGLAKNNEGFKELNDYLSYHLHNDLPIEEEAPIFFNSYVIYSFVKDYRVLRDNEYIGIKPHELTRLAFSEWKKHEDKLVMLAPVTFRTGGDFSTHRLLRAIDKNIILSKLDKAEQARADEFMLHKYELIKIYGDYKRIIDNTLNLLGQCNINFEFGKNKNKKTFTGNLYEDELLLRKLCNENLKYRYAKPTKEIKERFEKEIKMITELGFAAYFLINWDIVNYAQRKNYIYVGRGSGANSMVAYLLRITDVDPVDLDLYFERFINAQRTSPPDFDLDFSWNDRDDVTDYIFKKHGHTHTAQLATYNTFQHDSLIRELGKVFGLPKEEIDAFGENEIPKSTPDTIAQLILKYAKRIHDMPNYLSIHAGGILISEQPIHYYTATNMPPKGKPLTQFSMLEAEDVGLYKFDILSQRGLGKIKDAVDIIKQNTGEEIDIHNIKRFKEDAKVRANLQEANLMGCFYVESPAMRMLLKKLRASTYLDLVAASSIIRPGVAQSGMMREYILRFHDESRRTFIHPLMKELMSETFGVMVYQEDVIKVAHYFAGLTLTEADMLRRGMSGKYRGRAEFDKVEKTFFDNCKKKGYADEITKEVWRQIESFAGYAFSKGHSASYAVESYQCMFLKTYYPLEYMVAVMNNGGGFFALEFYVHEARMCGAVIHLPDINKSEHLNCIYGKDIYLGFGLLKELEATTSENVLSERAHNGNFLSLDDFMKRVSIAVEQLRILIRIGAFRFTGRTKKQLLWDIHSIIGANKKTEARKELFEVPNRNFELPALYDGKYDDAFDEIEILDFAMCSPFELIAPSPALPRGGRELLPANSNELVNTSAELKNHLGKIISIVGYLVTRKPTRTKKGDAMAFGTFLDKEGKWIDTTHFPNVLKQFPFTGRACYLITGKVVAEFGFYSLDVTEMKRLDFVERFSGETKDVASIN